MLIKKNIRVLVANKTEKILSNKNNPIIEVIFQDIYPTSLGALEYTQAATDVEYMTATADFAYKIYEINTL